MEQASPIAEVTEVIQKGKSFVSFLENSMYHHLSLGDSLISEKAKSKNFDRQHGLTIIKGTQKIRCEATYEAKQEQI